MNGFWWTWIKIWLVGVALFGVMLMGGAAEATSGPIRIFYTLLNGPGEFELDAHTRFNLGVMGPITLGWTLTMIAAMVAANQLEGESACTVWRLIFGSIVFWYVVDSGLSVYTRFWRNTIPNTVLMGTFMLPVIRSGVLKG